VTNEPDEAPPPEDAEVVDGLPVLAAPPEDHVPAEPAPPGGMLANVPTRQVAALAASGFVAGAATVAMVHRRRSRSLRKQLARKKSRTALGEIVGSNSFLVDVHLIRRD